MAVAEQEKSAREDEGLGRGAALKAAGAAAATGAAALVVQKALASRGKTGGGSEDEDGGGEKQERREKRQKKSGKRSGSGSSLFQSAASGGWDAARDTLVPLAEDAAGAAGTYVAEHSPEFVTEKLVPRFIESFNKAKG
jgi:hypothetical protein